MYTVIPSKRSPQPDFIAFNYNRLILFVQRLKDLNKYKSDYSQRNDKPTKEIQQQIDIPLK